MDKREFGAFLRSRRERISPAEVGLPAGPRRRTPGLRRDEVAHLAFISTEYYTRLEQARAPHPSGEVLSGLVRALRLSDAERAHLYLLAGVEPQRPPGPPRVVRQSIVDLLQRLPRGRGHRGVGHVRGDRLERSRLRADGGFLRTVAPRPQPGTTGFPRSAGPGRAAAVRRVRRRRVRPNVRPEPARHRGAISGRS